MKTTMGNGKMVKNTEKVYIPMQTKIPILDGGLLEKRMAKEPTSMLLLIKEYVNFLHFHSICIYI